MLFCNVSPAQSAEYGTYSINGFSYTGAGTGIFGGYIANNGDAIGNKITVASSTTNYVALSSKLQAF